MKMPSNYTKDEVVHIIDRIVNRISKKFRFGYYTLDDIKQQGRLFALEGLDGYDGVRPLENFLWTHVHNRLINFKRDEYERREAPCLKCKQKVKRHCKDDSILTCLIYNKWVIRNRAKRNLMTPIEISHVEDEKEDSMKSYVYSDDEISENEVKQLIDKFLPINLRKDYLLMINGDHVSKTKQDKIRAEVKKILEDNNYEY